MAGHSKFKNIQHRKGAQDKRRAKVFTKLVREIITAARTGGGDQHSNPRLRNAIIAARSHNLPKERIERAVSQAHNDTDVDNNYVEIRYEGFAPSGIAIIVEALTDNKNRAAAEVRAAFTKFGGNLAETGSVSFMFEHLGIIHYPISIAANDTILSDAIVAAATDVVSDELDHCIYTEIDKFSDCLDFFTKKYGVPTEAYIGWKPRDVVLVSDKDKAEKLLKLVDMLEESDDVQRVFGNYELSDEVHNLLL